MLYGQGVQMAIQLVSVPVLAAQWGLAGYGAWLVLFTVPSLLAISDFGLIAATGNAMTVAVARGEREHAATLYATVRAAMAVLALGLLAIAVIAIPPLWPLFAGGLTVPGGHGAQAALLLVAYALCGLAGSVTMVGQRATDHFATSTVMQQTVVLVEASASLLVVALGGGLRDAALAYLAIRLGGTGLLALDLRRRAPWLVSRFAPDWPSLRPLLRPALATMPLPAGYAVTLQGAIATIGATAGVAAIPAFAATRTLTRTALQLTFAVNVASMPQFTVAAAQGDLARGDRLVLANLVTSLALLLPAAAGLLLFGQDIVNWWIGNRIVVPFGLLAILVAAMLLNGAWVPISNLILAINRQAGYSYMFLATALVGTGIGYVAANQVGDMGAALGVLLIEAAMVIRVLSLAHQLGILMPSRLLGLVRVGIGQPKQ